MAESNNVAGCAHYRRKCQLVAPCCGETYTCRFCHDDNEKCQLIVTEVQEIVCLDCQKRQEVSNACINCNVVFGRYFCGICRLFDDEDKQQFHCDDCGLCRVGGRENVFHCHKCGICFNNTVKNGHKCIENVSKSECPVCLCDLHTSTDSGPLIPCGHLLHRACFNTLVDNWMCFCPICRQTFI